MINLRIALLSAATIISISGCNNQTANRLSATNACDSSVRAQDPTAYGLTAKEIEDEIYQPLSAADFPDNEALAVRSIVTTFEVALENEKKAVIRVINSNPQGNPNGLSVQCIKNFTLDDAVTKEVTIPISNQGGVQLKKFTLILGNPQLADKSDFIKLIAVAEEVDEAGAEDTPISTEPVPFTDYFSEAGDEFQFFKIKEVEGKEISEEDRLKESYFIHYKNDAERVRSRMVVSRIIKAEDKK